MNLMIITAVWRERFTRPIVVGLLLAFAVIELIGARQSLTLESPAVLLTTVMAAGQIGRDLSSGAMSLLFTRPISRARYLTLKWIAAGLAGALLSLVHIAIQIPFLRQAPAGEISAMLGPVVLESVTASFGLSAVLICFGSFVRGLGDLALWVVLRILLGLVGYLGAPRPIMDQLTGFLLPSIEWGATFVVQPISWLALFSYASTVTLCLALGIVALNRREISYASG